MTWKIQWPATPEIQSYGRNRSAMQVGLRLKLYDWSAPHRLILKPINSKGKDGEGCLMEVPVDQIDVLILQLQVIKAHLGR